MGRSLVLIFHDAENGPFFERSLVSLKARYSLVSLSCLEEMLIEGRTHENACHLTFDDGDRSFYTNVFPVLKKHNTPASLYVSPHIIGTKSNYWFQETQNYDPGVLRSIISRVMDIPVSFLKNYSCRSMLKCLSIKKINSIIRLYREETHCGEMPPQNMTAEQLKEISRSGFI